MVSLIGKIVLGLTLALLVCGCGVAHDPSYAASGCANEADGKCADVNAYNDLWIIDNRSDSKGFLGCVQNPDIGLDYCTHDPLDPEYRFWINEGQVDEKRMKWLVKI